MQANGDAAPEGGNSSSSAEERVNALAAALATLTQEKNALQAGLVEDKRRMAQQHKEALAVCSTTPHHTAPQCRH
jgi:hypothetical protein